MSTRLVPILATAAVVLLALLASLFTVGQDQLAIRTEFGAIRNASYAPGLHWKWPWDEVVKFDKRVLTQTHAMASFTTSDDRSLVVDFYVKWRIADPTRYFEAVGDESSAGDRLSDIVEDDIKRVVADRTLADVIAADRPAVTPAALASARRAASALGIDLLDVRVQNLGLPDEVAGHVEEKMKEGFEQTANALRAEGERDAKRIRAEADRKHTEIVSVAQRDALVTKGAADAQAADIYAAAYNVNPEFYAFYRSMQAYERSLGKPNGVLVLSPDSEFFKYMQAPGRARR